MRKDKIYRRWRDGMMICLMCSLVGCAARQERHITIDRDDTILMPDNHREASFDVTFRVPADYLTKRQRIVIVPRMMAGNELLTEYEPVVLDAPIYAKKRYRREKLENYEDPYKVVARLVEETDKALRIPYHATVQLPEGMTKARLCAVVSADGCGECSGIDTIALAEIADPLSGLVRTWHMVEPEFVVREKRHDGEGKAHFTFAINRYDIDPELGNNRTEMEKMLQTLRPVLTDSLATLDRLSIIGIASADGPLKLNTELAFNRAEAAKSWLVGRLGINAATGRKIMVDSRPEGWKPVLEAMRAVNDPDAEALAGVLDRYADVPEDTQERYIRRLAAWDNIRKNYLAGDRVVEYRYSYTIRSFTSDSEMLALYATRPDAFNEAELLRVSTLVATDAEREAVYRTTLRLFPASAVAANNLALMLIERGDETEAGALLEQVADELPEARYNLGLLKALNRETEEAIRLLEPFDDENARLVKRLMKKE